MDTEEDAARERMLDELYGEWERENAEGIKEKGIDEFLQGLARAYFLENPGLATRVSQRLTEARSLLSVNSSACLALACSAMELGFKELLLKPAIIGFVHARTAAAIIAEIVISRSYPEHLKIMLSEILDHIGIRDSKSLKIGEREDSFWNHMEHMRKRRNAVLHNGEVATPQEAGAAIEIAHLLIDRVFPLLVRLAGLKLDEGVVKAS
jgi:hypothetical protein